MENLLIPLRTGKTLQLNVQSIVDFFEGCANKYPFEVSQQAINAFTGLTNLIAKEDPVLAEHIIQVAKEVLANSEII